MTLLRPAIAPPVRTRCWVVFLHVIKMLRHSVYMRGKMGARVFVLTGCACLLTIAQASAGTLLADRATLEALLGPTAITEDFEAFDFVGPILNLSSPVDSSTAPIVNGVAFSGVGTGLRITDQSNVGRTQELGVVGSGDFSLLIDFSEPTDAFGLTFFPFVLVGTDVTVNVFAPDDNTLLQSHTVTAFFNFGQFIGVHELGGIGSVSVSAIAAPPLDFVRDFHIDQLTFGSRPSVSVPEPATTVLLIVGVAALGAVRRSRRHRM